jgi:sortase A
MSGAPDPGPPVATLTGMGVRRALRGIGKTSIAAGILILLFVAYQLWGTGIAESHSQHALRKQFAAEPSPTVTPTTTAGARTDPATSLPAPPVGAAVAIIKIPKIGVDAAVVQGVGEPDLQKGPGHYPSSPMPGQAGNAAIAGHRTTYGAPFYRLNELQPGDDIFISTKTSPTPWHYVVISSMAVSPNDVAVLNPTRDNRLTLTTCNPRFSASQRLVVVSKLVGAVDPTPPMILPQAQANLGAADVTLSGTGASTAPAIAWGIACAAVWALAWGAGRKWGPWWAYSVGLPVFLICLFFFFQNFARFVPANI